MIRDLGNNVWLDASEEELRLSGWSRYRRADAPLDGLDAMTDVVGSGPLCDVGEQGGALVVRRVRGRIAMNPARSWVVAGRETSALLEHEQGHIHIAYIAYTRALHEMRSIVMPLDELAMPGRLLPEERQALIRRAVSQRTERILHQARGTMSKLTRDYDGLFPPGTNHGINRIEQARWSAWFATAMAAEGRG